MNYKMPVRYVAVTQIKKLSKLGMESGQALDYGLE
jgi:uncharacterized protein YoaH (UPF0181 family)